jgi:hypothetical protein
MTTDYAIAVTLPGDDHSFLTECWSGISEEAAHLRAAYYSDAGYGVELLTGEEHQQRQVEKWDAWQDQAFRTRETMLDQEKAA